jgi:hypothetical protein
MGFEDIWRTHQLFGFFFLSLAFAWQITKKYNAYAGLALAYTLISAVIVFQGPAEWSGYEARLTSSANAFGIIFESVAFIAYLDQKGLDAFYKFLEWVVIVNCTIVIFNGYGIFNAYSMDNVFAVMMIPIMWFRNWPARSFNSWIYYSMKVVIPLIAMYKTGGSTSFIALTAIFAAFAIATGILELIVLITITAAVGVFVNGSYLFNPGQRATDWPRMMAWWYENQSMFLGSGTGTFEWISFFHIPKGPEGYAIWLHNDYLQAIFEQGLVGFFLYSVLAIYCVKQSWRKPWLFASFAGVAVIMFTFYPFRFILSELVIVCLLRESFECNQNQSQTYL